MPVCVVQMLVTIIPYGVGYNLPEVFLAVRGHASDAYISIVHKDALSLFPASGLSRVAGGSLGETVCWIRWPLI